MSKGKQLLLTRTESLAYALKRAETIKHSIIQLNKELNALGLYGVSTDDVLATIHWLNRESQKEAANVRAVEK